MIEVPRSPIRGVALTEQWSCGSLRKVEWPCKLSISYERDNLPFLWWPVVVRSLRGSVARGVHCACMSLQKVGVNQDIKNHSSWGTTRTKSLTVIVSRTQESAGILTQVMVEPIREGEQSRPLPYLFRARGRRLLHWCSRGHPRRGCWLGNSIGSGRSSENPKTSVSRSRALAGRCPRGTSAGGFVTLVAVISAISLTHRTVPPSSVRTPALSCVAADASRSCKISAETFMSCLMGVPLCVVVSQKKVFV
ncbi:uncharacterized protein [Desmodus rotundus]|uniref:uncharacterized protein isoform X2 n=1 Tax=Desmodus rotundus TaxID=9430 RepID=UPI0039E448BF